MFGQFDKNNDGGDRTTANSSDEFECRLGSFAPVDISDPNFPLFIQVLMQPLRSSLGFTDNATFNFGYRDRFDLISGPLTALRWDLGISDLDVTSDDNRDDLVPLGPYRISIAVQEPPNKTFLNAGGGSFILKEFDDNGVPKVKLTDSYDFINFLPFTDDAIKSGKPLGFTVKQKFICGNCEGESTIFSHIATVDFTTSPFTVTFQ